MHYPWFRLDLSHPCVRLLHSLLTREDSDELCSVGRIPELKCLCRFCDPEISEPEPKNSWFPTDLVSGGSRLLSLICFLVLQF